MLAAFLYCFAIIFIYATIWFAVAVYKKRNDVADIAWGIGYIIICIFLFINYPASAVLNHVATNAPVESQTLVYVFADIQAATSAPPLF